MKGLFYFGLLLAGFAMLLGVFWSRLPSLAETALDDTRPAPEITLLPGNQLKQGGILTIRIHPHGRELPDDVTVKFDGRTGRLFKQQDGWYETLFGVSVDTRPGTHKIVLADATGTSMAQATLKVLDGRFAKQNIRIGKKGAGLQPLPGELEAIQALKKNVTPVRYWQPNGFISPTPDCENSPFGVKRYHNGVYTHDYHKGVDLRSPQGRPIKAIADGVVKIAAPHFRLHGGTVGLDHGQGVNSIYIHMSKVAVTKGQKVKKGDIIGYVGATGFATGPHLHWGLYVNGVPVNPNHWIRAKRC